MYNKEKYQSKREAGLCVWSSCQEKTERVFCKQHAAKHIEYVQKRYRRYRDKDLCVICGGTVEGRMYACTGCRDLYNEKRRGK